MYLGTFSTLEGNYQDIGCQEAAELQHIPGIEQIIFSDSLFTSEELAEKIECLTKFYPELVEELTEVARKFNKNLEDLRFVQDSYLTGGGCSLGALKPSNNTDQKMYLFRTYDMNPDITEIRLCSTKPSSGYTHTGFSTQFFGRSDGMNEHGLCVMFASCGMPVGHYPGMQKPKINGFNFMVVVRLLLEKCLNVEEAIDLFLHIPIASNVNLLVADSQNKIAILETLNGIKDHKLIEENHAFLTNHAVLEEIKRHERVALTQSKTRERTLHDYFKDSQLNSKESINELIATEYPQGLTSLNYGESFGTVYTVIFNVTDKQISYSFGSSKFNPVYDINVGEVATHGIVPVQLPHKHYGSEFWSID